MLNAKSLKEIRDLNQKDSDAIRAVCADLSARVNAVDDKVGAYLNFDDNDALSQVDALTKLSDDEKKALPLYGVPISIKNNICVKGWETTCSSRILKGHVPPYDATVIQKLKNAGAILFAKCNMDEFAFGSSTETSAWQKTRNPWDLERVPGGSSGGSAACVASDSAIASLGSDTGGSIRQPASFCGVVGLKPTYGRVSRYGLVAFGSSLDQIGPITKTVEDSALLMNVIAGHDGRDSTSVPHEVTDHTKGLGDSVKGLKIGLPKEYFSAGLDAETEKAVRETANFYASQGAEIIEVSLPHTEYAVAVYYVGAVAEASSNLSRFDGVRFGNRAVARDLQDMYLDTRDAGFGAEAKRRILLGTFVLSHGYYDAYYLKSQKVRTLIIRDFEKAFEQVDIILSPVSPMTAFKFGEKSTDPLAMYLSDVLTIPASHAGLPAISVNCGWDSKGMPIGMQLIGKHFDEALILKTAFVFEQSFEQKKPSL